MSLKDRLEKEDKRLAAMVAAKVMFPSTVLLEAVGEYDKSMEMMGLDAQLTRAEVMDSDDHANIEMWNRLEAFGSVSAEEFRKYINKEWAETKEPTMSAEDFIADLERL